VRERGTCCSSQDAERVQARHATEGIVRRREGSKKALLRRDGWLHPRERGASLAKVELAFKTGSGKEPEPWTLREFWMKERLGSPYHGFVDLVADRGAEGKEGAAGARGGDHRGGRQETAVRGGALADFVENGAGVAGEFVAHGAELAEEAVEHEVGWRTRC
jgi:hypothetical protein